jgi:hypothetical protein
MVVMVVVMMLLGSERRAGKHHQEQNGGKNLLHAKNVPRTRPRRKCLDRRASKEERAAGILAGTETGVN